LGVQMLLPRGRISYLVEVDVHALELEVGSTVVTVACQMGTLALFCNRWTYTPEESRPCSPEMVCQKAAPTWLPFVDVNYTLFISLSSG
jgi:hypothetical protein